MTIYDEIKKELEKSPRARERKNKNAFIAWILEKKYAGRIQTGIDRALLEDFVRDSATYDRAWRQVLQLEVSLRGTDYEDKKTLEQEKELELGYMPGYNSDIKKIKTL